MRPLVSAVSVERGAVGVEKQSREREDGGQPGDDARQTPPTRAPQAPRRRQAQKIASWRAAWTWQQVDDGDGVLEVVGSQPATLDHAEPTKRGDEDRGAPKPVQPIRSHSHAIVIRLTGGGDGGSCP